MNNGQNNKKSKSKHNLQNKNNVKPLIFTFLGAFIVFFFIFTVLLPIFTPKVDIPALTDEHSMGSVDSNDFKGRIDPRLSSIEQEENTEPPKLKMEIPAKEQLTQSQQTDVNSQNNTDPYSASDEPQEPQSSISDETYNQDYNENYTNTVQQKKTQTKTLKQASSANIPPRPKTYQQPANEITKPLTMAKVVLGSYATPMQARLVSDTLIEMDLNVAPFIKEKNGRYLLQVGSFSDVAKADELVQELQSRGFNARTVNE